MIYPVQSLFAAALLGTLAFSLNDASTAPAAQPGGDAALQFACDQDNLGANAAADADLTPASPCSLAYQR